MPRTHERAAMRLALVTSAPLAVLLAACAPPPPLVVPPPERAHVVPVVMPPRYAVPTCPLGYEVTTLETSAMVGAPASMRESKLLTVMTVELRPAGSRVELTTAMTSQPLLGKHRSYVVPDTAYAPVHLETDGSRWVEQDGPTQVFDVLGTQGGLVWFFPELPRSGEVGATVDWELANVDPLDVMKTEAARGAHPGFQQALDAALVARSSAPAEPKAKVAQPVLATVRLDGWKTVQGMRVAELSMTLTEGHEKSMPLGGPGDAVHARASVRGSYQITSAGRLLSARIDKDTTVDMTGPTPGLEQHHEQHASRRMNLVRACDGPTEASLVTPLTREERAIHAWGDTWVALRQGEREKVLAALDPALVAKHGAPRVWDALTSIVSLRGERVIGPPLLVRDEDVTSTGATVRLVTHGDTRDMAQPNTLTPVDSTITLREEGGRWVVEAMLVELTLHAKNLGEISLARVVARKGWPPR